MKRCYKGCTLKAVLDKGSDGIERVYASAVDDDTGYIIMEEFYLSNITVPEVMKDIKLVVDSYRENEELWVNK